MENILRKITSQEKFSRAEAKELLIEITESKYSDEQISAILTGIQMRGVSVDEILGLRDGLLATGKAIDFTPYDTIDIVGTGGDGKNTFNISTAACFVVAGAGYKVTKHGNYAASSVSGASNVLEAHGIKFNNDNSHLKHCLETCGFVYLHAPLFANGMKSAAPARKQIGALGTASCFNLLGPLVNPCRPNHQLLGVANLAQMRLYQQVYQRMGIQFGIVTSTDGYDEISLTSDFKVITNHSERIYTPKEIGMKTAAQSELFGGETAEDAKRIFDNVLTGKGTEAQNNAVIANAAFAIQVMEPEKEIEDCIAIADESLKSGKAAQVLQRYIDLNK
ncbi:MAG: anthranilate phosphoribosyltransferase [Bacteroidales bacterium]|nr:anthranilate phosphoribosyltransferase [Bacteroidales bacterium]MBP5134574.1 anthranilate phosphoribosyltransferase [Paludibacteraceae bacterium]MBR6310896.1 anthranilate phosphoribosyltransferase [Paludibacteraceae bacterium]